VTPIVALSRVHGLDAQGPAGSALGALNNVTCMLEAGLHLFVGAPSDGTAALVDLVTGLSRPRIGAVSVAGRDPAASPAIRRRIGSLPLHPVLPPLGTVAAVARWLGFSDDMLAAVGAGSLANRPVTALDPVEARSVALAWALGRPDPLAVALHDPFAAVPAGAEELVRSRIAAMAARACVIVTTAETGELEGLSATVYLLDGGELLAGEVGWPRGAPAELVVWLDGTRAARELTARLARDHVIERVGFDGGCVRVAAASLALAARAVAASSRGLPLISLRAELPSHQALVTEMRRRRDERHASARLAAMQWPSGPEHGS
jgi:ABC-type thiamine transport system ATPase subunit